MKKLIILTIIAGLLFIRQIFVFADAVDKITWCHVEPNGNQETLELPQQALEQAGHVDAKGNPLHAGDHPGSCITPTVVVSPPAGVSPTSIPTTVPTEGVNPTGTVPTPSPVIPSPSTAPTGVQPTNTPSYGTPSYSTPSYGTPNSSAPANPDQVSAMGPGEPSKGIPK